MKHLLLFLLLTTQLGASENLEPQMMETQETIGTSLGLPISLNSNGEVDFFKSGPTDVFSFSPIFHAGFSSSQIHYTIPLIAEKFALMDSTQNKWWMEVHRRRLEFGVGINTIIKQVVDVGLVSYKGSVQKLVKVTQSPQIEKMPLSFLPESFEDIKDWSIGDYGSFDAYGGVEAYVSAGISYVDLVRASVTFQNQFTIEIKRLSENKISLVLSEQDLKKRRLAIGSQLLANSIFSQINGSRFTAAFLLDMNEPSHHGLFEAALKGKLTQLQEELPFQAQSINWQGSNRFSFIGIPWTVGMNFNKGHYNLNEDGERSRVDFSMKKNKGILLSARLIQNFIYQTENHLVLFWANEMKKVTSKSLDRDFISFGRKIGIKGFSEPLSPDKNIGAVITQLGVTFSRQEVESFKDMDPVILAENFKQRCEFLLLSCREEKRHKKIMDELKVLLSQKWLVMRGKLGKLLVKEPALVNSVIKTMKLKKSGYFYFLSERFQSLEGSAPIGN